MDRRGFLGVSLATVVAAMAPGTLQAFEAPSNIVWGTGTLENRFAPLVADWCKAQTDGAILYMRGEIGMDSTLKLEDPKFVVKMGKPVWNWMTGYTDEDAPKIDIYEQGVYVASTSIATSDGYEEYWEHATARENPGDFVRKVSMPYEKQKELEQLLPKSHFGFDMRWLERATGMVKDAA